MRRTRRLVDVVAHLRPDIENPVNAIVLGMVLVDQRVITNPESHVRQGSSVLVRAPKVLRGNLKLRTALAEFGVAVRGRIALDVGAAAGGFTQALLEAGALRVYAVDAGHGQLLGSLRQDPRVVNLEATNLAALTVGVVPEIVEVITIDLSYLAISIAVRQLEEIPIAPNADLLALVKPMFELRLERPPTHKLLLDRSVEAAANGIESAGWKVVGRMRSPITGARGAIEFFLRTRRSPGAGAGRRCLARR